MRSPSPTDSSRSEDSSNSWEDCLLQKDLPLTNYLDPSSSLESVARILGTPLDGIDMLIENAN